MVLGVQQIKHEFLAYIKTLGGRFDQWYIGASADPEQALFAQHGVDRDGDRRIFKPTLSDRAATTIQR